MSDHTLEKNFSDFLWEIGLKNIASLFRKKQWWDDLYVPLMALYELLEIQNLEVNDDILKKYSFRKFSSGAYSSEKIDVAIEGTLIVSDTTKIKPYTYVEGLVIIGPDAIIGSHSVLRGPLVIGPKVRIGYFAEVNKSIFLTGAKLLHRSYVGYSVIGRYTNIGAGFIVATRNLKRKNVCIKLDDGLYDTNRTHFGIIMGDYVQVGIHVEAMPGRIIITRKPIMPNTHVIKNVIDPDISINYSRVKEILKPCEEYE